MDHDAKAPEPLPNQPGLEVWRSNPSDRRSSHVHLSWPWSNGKPTYHDAPSQSSHRRVGFGNGLVVGVMSAMVVVGIALGGGLGTALSTCRYNLHLNTSAASATTTPTPTTNSLNTSVISLENYAPADPNEVATLKNDCDPSKNTTNSFGDVFSPSCNFDYYNNFTAAEGGVVADIILLVSYSWKDCLDACSGLNNRSSKWDMPTRCRSVVFHINMRDMTAQQLGNCWLKNATLADPSQAKASKYAMSAKLIAPLW